MFAYEYHPGSTGLGQEPEGLDWWDLDVPDSLYYDGQLHAILLDNQAGDDQIWLKHYRVDYCACVGDADSDGYGEACEPPISNDPLPPDDAPPDDPPPPPPACPDGIPPHLCHEN